MDTQTIELLERVRLAGRKPLHTCTANEARTFPTLMKLLFGPGAVLHAERDMAIPGPGAKPLHARLYLPTPSPDTLIVFFHGGGWVLGSVADHGPFTSRLAHFTGAAVLSVEYGLAPEHPFPGPVLDAVAALAYAGQAGEQWLGRPVQRLVAMGDSAGATLATVATRHLRATPAQRQVDLQLLVYPVTDAGFDTPSYHEFAEDHLLTARDMRWFWDQYCPDLATRNHPDASPLKTPDLRGMPPTRIFTAELDPLRDEGEHYAQRLADAGVDCKLVRCTGTLHAFLAMIHYSPNAAKAFELIVQALTTGGETPP